MAYYPLTNTAVDPTNAIWVKPVGYSFVPNDGIYCTNPITDMSNMFRNSTINDPDMANWDVSTVTNMENMFFNADEFDVSIGSWDVSNVTNMNGMFNDTAIFNRSLVYWDVTNISSKPINFDTNNSVWNEHWKPFWGTSGYSITNIPPPKYFVNLPNNYVAYNMFVPDTIFSGKIYVKMPD